MVAIDFSDWYNVEPSCFLFKQPRPYSGIYLLVFPLQRETWLFCFISLVGIAFFYLVHSRVAAFHPYWSFDMLLLYEASVMFKESDRRSHRRHTYALRCACSAQALLLLAVNLASEQLHLLFPTDCSMASSCCPC